MHASMRLALVSLAFWSLLPSCNMTQPDPEAEAREGIYHKAVSYTHLTLPTKA